MTGFLFSSVSWSMTQFVRQNALMGLRSMTMRGGVSHASISKDSTGRLNEP
ncbi:hypothetical protein EVA_13382 [gut metagenome]|uniref:Uncharacterized protein n=1 Tax=gut metagenome TaxID=749906 RepID=J9CET2_9ZZZZ